MLNKYDLLSYFFSVLLNSLFLLIFFSSLNFKYNKEKKIKVKLISYQTKSLSPTLNLSAPDFQTLSNKLELPKKSKSISKPKSKNRPKLIKKTGKLVKKVNKSKINERLIKKKIAELEKKISSKKTSQKVQLSKQELQVLKEKLLALQRIEKITKGAGTNNISEINKQKIKGQGLRKKGSKGSLQEGLNLDYLLLVKAKLQNNFEVPIYLRNKKDLYVIVSIDVSSKGEILHYTFLKNSSVPEFNQAVERCLKASSPLPVNKKAKIIVEFRSEGIGKLR